MRKLNRAWWVVLTLALEIIGRHIYVLDSGRVQRLDQQTAAMPQVILAPNDEVTGVRVIEPLLPGNAGLDPT